MTYSKRQIQSANQIKKDLAAIFQQDPVYFFGHGLVTLTHVSVSPDLALAHVYLSVFPAKNLEQVFDHLNKLKSKIRLKLGKRIRTRARIVPELAFFYDDTEEKASKIESLIDDLDIPPNNM